MDNHTLMHELQKMMLHAGLAEKSIVGNTEPEVICRQHVREVKYLVEGLANRVQPELATEKGE